ncbi:molybdate ABC transporter substrate-binding protein [Verrucomicrobiota bacterium]
MKKVLLVLSVLIVLGLVFFTVRNKPVDENEVLVLCGGSMRAVLENIIERYEKVSDDNVVATYGGSGELCSQIQNTGRGDVFICHDPFMPWAEKQGLISKWDTMGYLDVVIIVPKGNPKSIKELKDLTRQGIRIGIGDRRYSTSGVISWHIMKGLDYGDDIKKNIIMESKGHQQRCTDVSMGTLDAGIVWSAVADLFEEKLEKIPVPEENIDAITTATYGICDLKNVKVTAGLIKHKNERESVQRFYDFLVTQRNVFEEYGFRSTGD